MKPPDDLFNLLPAIVKIAAQPFRYTVENVLAAIWQNGYNQAQYDEKAYWAEVCEKLTK